MNVVDAAIAYADREEHKGAGYSLRLDLVSGVCIQGPVRRRSETPIGVVEIVNGLSGPNDVTFVQKAHVLAARVIW